MNWISHPKFGDFLPQGGACRAGSFLVAQELEGVVHMGVRDVVEVHKVLADPPQLVHSREDSVLKIWVLSVGNVPVVRTTGLQPVPRQWRE